MPDSVKVEVRGIRELAGALKRVDDELPKELKVAFLKIAEKVVGVAAGNVPVISGKAAGSIKPRASTRGGSLAFGGTAAEYFPWLEWGGRVGRNKSIELPVARPGRYVYSAIISQKEETAAAAEKAVADAAKHAGFETH